MQLIISIVLLIIQSSGGGSGLALWIGTWAT